MGAGGASALTPRGQGPRGASDTQKQPRRKSRHVSKVEDQRRGSERPRAQAGPGPRSTGRRRRTGCGDASPESAGRVSEPGLRPRHCSRAPVWSLQAECHTRVGRPPHCPWDRQLSSRARGGTACLDFRASEDPGSEASRPPAAGMASARKTFSGARHPDRAGGGAREGRRGRVRQQRACGKRLGSQGQTFISNNPSREWVPARGPHPPRISRGVKTLHCLNRLHHPTGGKIAVSPKDLSSFFAQTPQKVNLWLASQGRARQRLS